MISKEDNWELVASDWDTRTTLEADNSASFSSNAINERVTYNYETNETMER